MAIYKILKGSHQQREGEELKTYSANGSGAGRYVETDQDLDKMFPNKFKRVDMQLPASEDSQPKRQVPLHMMPLSRRGLSADD